VRARLCVVTVTGADARDGDGIDALGLERSKGLRHAGEILRDTTRLHHSIARGGFVHGPTLQYAPQISEHVLIIRPLRTHGSEHASQQETVLGTHAVIERTALRRGTLLGTPASA
jgi:hypothetical protein